MQFGIKPLDWWEMKAVDSWALMDLIDRQQASSGSGTEPW